MDDTRYTLLRKEFAKRYGDEKLVSTMQALRLRLGRDPVDPRERSPAEWHGQGLGIPSMEGQLLMTLSTVDKLPSGCIQDHVSVSIMDLMRRRVSLPTWNHVVLVRALAWPDNVEVHQTLPALTGPHATPWVSINDTLHLIRRWES